MSAAPNNRARLTCYLLEALIILECEAFYTILLFLNLEEGQLSVHVKCPAKSMGRYYYCTTC